MRLGGQIRVVSGMTARVLGWDLVAAFTLADALGFDRAAVAVFLPDLEHFFVRSMNQQTEDSA